LAEHADRKAMTAQNVAAIMTGISQENCRLAETARWLER
jgi:hypothetical protein